jgi:hypothetical protein
MTAADVRNAQMAVVRGRRNETGPAISTVIVALTAILFSFEARSYGFQTDSADKHFKVIRDALIEGKLRESPRGRPNPADRWRNALAVVRRRPEWIRSRHLGPALGEKLLRPQRLIAKLLKSTVTPPRVMITGQAPLLWRCESEDGPCGGAPPA